MPAINSNVSPGQKYRIKSRMRLTVLIPFTIELNRVQRIQGNPVLDTTARVAYISYSHISYSLHWIKVGMHPQMS